MEVTWNVGPVTMRAGRAQTYTSSSPSQKSIRYSTLPATVNATRPPTGVHAKPLPENAIVTV